MSPKAKIVVAWTYTAIAAVIAARAVAQGSVFDIVGGGALLVWIALEVEESVRITKRVWSR